MNEPRVVFPMLALSPAGGIRVTCAVANALAGAGVAVRIYAPVSASTPPIALHEDVNLQTLGAIDTGKVAYMRLVASALRRERGIAVSTGYLTPTVIFAGGASRNGRLRMVSLIQAYEPQSHIRYGHRPPWIRPLLHALAHIGFRLPGYKMAVSQWVADRVGHRRVDEIISPGIRRDFIDAGANAAEFARLRAERVRPVLGFFPMTEETKGIRFALEAMERLRAEGLAFDAMVFDVDYATDHLPESIARYSAIALAGATEPSIIDFYRRCDVFVFPSLVEGFGRPPLEAMACGAPVVLTDSGGPRDFARDGENCLMVPPADAATLAGGIARMLDDAALRDRVIVQGLATAQLFPEEAFVARVADTIRGLLGP